MLLKDRLLAWSRSIISNERYKTFEDLHFDEIDELPLRDLGWLGCLSVVAKTLVENRNQIEQGFVAAIAITLRSGEEARGVNFSASENLQEQFTESPPSIYIFALGQEPWNVTAKVAVARPDNFFPWQTKSMEVFHLEYKEPYEQQYRRSLWVKC